MLSIPHISCASGQVLPIEDIGRIAKANGLFYFVDGAQALGCMPVDLQEIGCHAYATSGHKWILGPNGTGFLFVHRDWLDRVQATHVGAYSNAGDFSMETGSFSLAHSATSTAQLIRRLSPDCAPLYPSGRLLVQTQSGDATAN